jgi:hypothetical protein
VFARVDRATYSTQLRVNYTVKPDLTLDIYGEPFAASGAYGPTQELVAARSGELRPFAVPGNRDFNTKSFRSNVVLRGMEAWQHAIRRLAAESRGDSTDRDACLAR